MRILDEKGRLFGKLSIIDIMVVAAILVLATGFLYNRSAQHVRQIIMADTPLYVTFLVEGVRGYSVSAVSEGDIIFRQHERGALGRVYKIESGPAYDIMVLQDGTASLVPVENRYNMYITLECVGSVTDTGFFVNGTVQLSEGGRISIQSNNLLTMATVYRVMERE